MYSLNYELDTQNVKFWFNKATRKPLSLKGEFIEAAQMCKEKANGKIVVLFSGGVDSELVIRSLQYVGANFTVITFAYNTYYNSYDLMHARSSYKQLGIQERIIDFDIEKFIDYKIKDYQDQGYIGNNIYRYMALEFLKEAYKYGDYPVISSGEQRFSLKSTEDNVYINQNNIMKYIDKPAETGILMSAGTTNILRYLKENKLNANPFFLYTTPELMCAYQQVPIIDFTLRQKNFYKADALTYGMKQIAYHDSYPDLRMRKKSNGFDEMSAAYTQKYTDILQTHYVNEPKNFWMPLARLREQIGLPPI